MGTLNAAVAGTSGLGSGNSGGAVPGDGISTLNPAIWPLATPVMAASLPTVLEFVGTAAYADTTALQAAFPAASNNGRYARVGAAAPHTLHVSNGTAWVPSTPAGRYLAVGYNGGNSQIASAVTVSPFREECFTYLGGPAARPGLFFPANGAMYLGQYPQITSPTPTAIEFTFSTNDSAGRFEIAVVGTLNTIRVCVLAPNGKWEYLTSAASFSHPSDGGIYFDMVALGAAGTYGIRLELSNGSRFRGIRCAAADTVQARPKPKERVLVVGDSFTEPNINDVAGTFVANDGWPQQLAHLTGWDVWSAGSGGTGYLNPSTGRVKFRDRLAQDILAFNPTKIIWAGGINDSSGYTAAEVRAEALACFNLVKQSAPACQQIVLDLFWPRGINGFPTTLLQYSDAVRAAAADAGLMFVPMLQQPIPEYLALSGAASWEAQTLAAVNTNATSIQTATIPTYFLTPNRGTDGWHVRIGSGNLQSVRGVSFITGTGPYTINLLAGLPAAFPAGSRVVVGADSYITGTGTGGSPAGDGNSDRVTGPNDPTHPSKFGHAHIARVVATNLARVG